MKLQRLLFKYERLVELRSAREELIARGATCFPPDAAAERKLAFRAIARQFPGALRELDALPLAELQRRLHDVKKACERGESAPWMQVAIDYHLAWRDVLRARRQDESPARPERAAGLRRRLGLPPPPRASAEGNPARGRWQPLVLAHVAERHGLSSDEVERLLFVQACPPPRQEGSGSGRQP